MHRPHVRLRRARSEPTPVGGGSILFVTLPGVFVPDQPQVEKQLEKE